ncbi:hypothetical protein SNE40_014236 [Patella caerulea]
MLHEMYQELTGDCISASQRVSKSVRTRLRFLLDSEDPDLAVDLRQFNSGPQTKYDSFFEGVQSYINENSLEAAQERRHNSISRMALAISVPDLIRQVEKTLPPETPIPSESYVRLQFWPKNKHFQSALHYTGKFHIKYMVQTRQIRLSLVDAHYAAATYRYLKEFCVKFRDFCTVLCIDDKVQVKLGESGFPIACTDRGRAAVVHVPSQEQHSAGDHDFSAFKLTPSATLCVDIPEKVDGSFYRGQLSVCVKDAIFQHSSPLRHAVEMYRLLVNDSAEKPILAIKSDGGPDHRLTYLSVKVSLIARFVTLDLTCLIAIRTASHQSYRNPVVRCMSTLNLGLQFISLMRDKLDEKSEQLLSKTNSMSDIRKCAEKILQSTKPCVDLLNEVFQWLEYTERPVKT